MISETSSDLTDLEFNLQRRLSPVSPDPGFVNRLNQRLLTDKKVTLEHESVSFTPILIMLGLLLGLGFILLIHQRFRSKST